MIYSNPVEVDSSRFKSLGGGDLCHGVAVVSLTLDVDEVHGGIGKANTFFSVKTWDDKDVES